MLDLRTATTYQGNGEYDKQAPVDDNIFADTTGSLNWGACGHFTSSRWWGVDLGADRYVGYIRMLNRDVATERLHDVDIYLGSSYGTVGTPSTMVRSGVRVDSNSPFYFTINARGRYLFLRNNAADGLTVCKLYVWASPTLAMLDLRTATTYQGNGEHDKQAPVDDNIFADTTGSLNWGACGHFTSSRWWGVDLGADRYVGYIRMLNRDVATERLHDVDIYLGSSYGTVGTPSTMVRSGVRVDSNSPFYFTINARGRYLFLRNNAADGLTVCKLYVWASQA
ncbi:hypothetical protein EMIHUDRAFT_432150 [Emiliania huxleyi CCMP1516]|uniref:F5/8 type C domain-containing protein n=2 Tax=Emiliania huxleyi TaxID=2903 RepID=A0A0D3JHR8_EMIH1|nr:hypothetical protein EMIHUDRAFT_432150 [Emiliania huxleyi CCMP1516]EOD23053.1 hypothetical protein EMIHUDRAFT_432150 [Emiliania huxleyi CCMP1516]|eukprot:XP_005775482.1 hypothetical protein EMIHUDRAFT_432150 [Emiliania huxleyi CCMP1516]